MRKVTLSLSDEVAAELDVAAKSMGLNRSAFVSMCVKRQMEEDALMKQLPNLSRVMEDAIKEVRLKRIEAGEKPSE